jgi:hypothetical protein
MGGKGLSRPCARRGTRGAETGEPPQPRAAQAAGEKGDMNTSMCENHCRFGVRTQRDGDDARSLSQRVAATMRRLGAHISGTRTFVGPFRRSRAWTSGRSAISAFRARRANEYRHARSRRVTSGSRHRQCLRPTQVWIRRRKLIQRCFECPVAGRESAAANGAQPKWTLAHQTALREAGRSISAGEIWSIRVTPVSAMAVRSSCWNTAS